MNAPVSTLLLKFEDAPAAFHACCRAGRVALFSLVLAVVAPVVALGQAKPARPAPLAPPTLPPEAGLTYTNERVPSEPWSIHVLKVDRSQRDLEFFSAHARNKVLAVSLIAEQARSVPPEIGRTLAGINGDFYVRDTPTYAGDPRGLQIVNGELISAPSTVCVWFDTNGHPHLDDVKGEFLITWPNGRQTPFGLNEQRLPGKMVLFTPTYGATTRANGGRELILTKVGRGAWLPLAPNETYRARIRAVQTTGNNKIPADSMVLSIAADLLPDLPDLKPGLTLDVATTLTPNLKGVKSAIAGGPAVLRNGVPFAGGNPPASVMRNYSERSKYERHPRSAIGWSPTHIYLVTVDGRQPGLSMGMKLAELGQYFLKLGCTDAMNFDGGKSAQMWVAGHIMNSPAQGEDTVANSLLIVRKPAKE
jgi:hypothetical protein